MKRKLLPILITLVLLFTSCATPTNTAGVNSLLTASDVTVSNGTVNDIVFIPDDREEETRSDIPNIDSVCNGGKSHKDSDDNGVCDSCNESVIVLIDFYAINDLHGKFDDTESQIGVDELTTYFKNAKKTDDHVVLLSSGDMWQGSAESNTTKGKIITDWMNELDFVSMTLGNHEFDWGEEPIKENVKLAEFPILAINVYDKTTNQRVDYVKSSVMVERGGIRIGIIGAIGNCYSSISSEQVSDIYFKVGDELTALVKAESQKLKNAGADIIVYSLHDGFGSSKNSVSAITEKNLSSYYDIELSNGYVDMVFEAHTHQKYTLYDGKGVYHLQAGGDNNGGVSHLEYGINFVTGTKKVNTANMVKTSDYANLQDDAIVKTLLNKYADELKEVNKVVGNNPSHRTSSQLCNLVARLYLEKGIEKWGNDYNIVLGGGFLKPRSPYELEAGEVKYSDLQMIFPFDNELVLCSIKGSDLKNKFMSNRSNYYVKYSSYGESIKKSISSNKTYYIIVDNYTSQYAPNNLKEIERLGPNIYARDLLADFFSEQ